MSNTIKKINVEGMSCSHCERAIKNALNEIEGVTSTEVDLNAKTVTVEYDVNLVTDVILAETIEEAGYEVI